MVYDDGSTYRERIIMPYTERKKRAILYGEWNHLTEYLRDHDRLCFQLPNGTWNMKPLTSEERQRIETRIKQLEKELGIK